MKEYLKDLIYFIKRIRRELAYNDVLPYILMTDFIFFICSIPLLVIGSIEGSICAIISGSCCIMMPVLLPLIISSFIFWYGLLTMPYYLIFKIKARWQW